MHESALSKLNENIINRFIQIPEIYVKKFLMIIFYYCIHMYNQ